jgi:hypothetical protein
MTPRALVAVLLSAAAAAFAVQPRVNAQSRERSLYVSALSESGAPVEDLAPTDLVVREDNAVREIMRVVPADDPMQIEILVDNTRAATDYIRDMRAALPPFVNALVANEGGHRNEVGLVAVAERPTILAEPTFDGGQLKKGIDRIFAQPNSGSYLLDAVIDVCKGFRKREATRPVIVALTTEGPEFSSRHFDLVLNALRDASAAFHVVVIGPTSNDTSDDARNRNIVLDRGPKDTGGRFEQLLTSMALPGKLTQLAAEITHQFKVTYVRPQSLIPPEHITVTPAHAGITVRGTPVREEKQAKP